MIEKSKRKVNPRRRLLIQLLSGIGILVALISAAFYALQPNSPQIVFVAPDDDGMDAIWIADLDHPENPRQLTPSNWISTSMNDDIQVASDGHHLLFQTTWTEIGYIREYYLLNVKTGGHESVLQCGHVAPPCGTVILSPDGRYVAYEQEEVDHVSESRTVNVMLYDVQTKTHELVYEFGTMDEDLLYGTTALQWLGNTGILIFRTELDSDEFIFYGVDKNEIVDRHTLNDMQLLPSFSNDGSRYAYDDHFDPDEGWSHVVNLRQLDHPDESLLDFDVSEAEGNLTFIKIVDWHPDNISILVNEYRAYGDDPVINHLNLYNTDTGEKTVLLDEQGAYYDYSSFNHDGSQLLYSKSFRDGYRNDDIIIYDMESGESTILPLSGWGIQWVNGGR